MKNKYRRQFCILAAGFCILAGAADVFAQRLDVFDAGGTRPSQELITLNFRDTEIREVLNIIAYKSGVNIVAGDDVKARVSIQIKDVEWERALDVLLKTYDFTYKREGNLIRIMSLTRAKDEENKVPLVTKIISLDFADVDTISRSLDKMLSPRGSIQVDKRTNSLLITDIADMVEKVEKAAHALDTRTPQVLIEAMMVEVKLTDDDKLGFGWSVSKASGKRRNFFSDLSLQTGAGVSATGEFIFDAGIGKFDISSIVDFWQSQNKAEILANPRVLTLDNQEAKIEILEEIPYIETVADPSGSGTKDTVKFKDAGIKLLVKPQISAGKFISMTVKPEQSFKSGEALGQPIIETRKAETNLLVRDGETIVIGGLRRRSETVSFNKVPLIGDVPLLGMLFKRKQVSNIDSELLLFVTPHIIMDPMLTENEQEWFRKIDEKPPLVIDERGEIEKFKAWREERRQKNLERRQQREQEMEKTMEQIAAEEQSNNKSLKESRRKSHFVDKPALSPEQEENGITESEPQLRSLLDDLRRDKQEFDKKISGMKDTN